MSTTKTFLQNAVNVYLHHLKENLTQGVSPATASENASSALFDYIWHNFPSDFNVTEFTNALEATLLKAKIDEARVLLSVYSFLVVFGTEYLHILQDLEKQL